MAGYPWESNPEKVDRRAWVRDNLSGIQVGGADLPATIRDIVRALVYLAMPDRIWLFGSRARGTARETSDFDLYVEGIRERDGFNRVKQGDRQADRLLGVGQLRYRTSSYRGHSGFRIYLRSRLEAPS